MSAPEPISQQAELWAAIVRCRGSWASLSSRALRDFAEAAHGAYLYTDNYEDRKFFVWLRESADAAALDAGAVEYRRIRARAIEVNP